MATSEAPAPGAAVHSHTAGRTPAASNGGQPAAATAPAAPPVPQAAEAEIVATAATADPQAHAHVPGKRRRPAAKVEVTTDRESAVPQRAGRASMRTNPFYVHRRPAGIVSRGLAFIIDLLIVVLTVALIYYLTVATLSMLRISITSCRTWVPIDSTADVIMNLCRAMRGTLTFVCLMVAPIYFLLGWLIHGQTIGAMIAGVRVVRTDGTPLKPRTALLRLAGLAGSLIVFGIGLLWAVVDKDRQGWHDKLARTYVIYWRREVAYKENHPHASRRLFQRREGSTSRPPESGPG